MKYYTLAVSMISHDASFALFENDNLVFYVQAERFERKKGASKVTKHSIKCFDYIFNNLTKRIDLLVVNGGNALDDYISSNGCFAYITEKFKVERVIAEEVALHSFSAIVNLDKIQNHSHHCSHALSAFYMSPFDEAVCLIIDAIGTEYQIQSPYNRSVGIEGVETTSILEIDNNYKRNYLYKKSQYAPAIFRRAKNIEGAFESRFSFNGGVMSWASDRAKKIFHEAPYKFDASVHLDIGNMYETVTRHLRMGRTGHGKVMGLSAYGNANNTLMPFLIDNTILSNNNLFSYTREFNLDVYPELAFENLSFQDKANVAYEVQKSLEKVFLHHAQFIKENSKMRNLVIGGGCALNILGISAIKEKYPEFNIFVDPIANDATHAIGIGIHYYNILKMKGQLKKQSKLESIYTGPQYKLEDMQKDIDMFLEKNK